ncbi:MAG: thioredoxin family protein [Bacteroidia bacterium]|nr:thioredoxin family protein [Bacteroidia bacterium]
MRHLLFTFIASLLLFHASAQIENHVSWTYSFSKPEVKTGEEVELIFTGKIDKNWYVYSTDMDPNLGPQLPEFTFEKHSSYQLVGKIVPIHPKHKYDEVWQGNISIFVDKAEMRQKVKILAANPVIKGNFTYLHCIVDGDGRCIPGDEDFEFKGLKVTVSEGTQVTTTPDSPSVSQAIAEDTTQATIAPSNKNEEIKKPETADVAGGGKSLWAFLIFAFLGGLTAVITPCVFPMLPMTVTFFTKKSETRAQALKRAFMFGGSIVLIYSLIGLLFGVLGLGPDFGNWLSTHWVPNVLFFIIFMVFGAAFLGMFELTLPSGFVNKIDSKSNMGSMAGVFFMAFTLVLVSFSCTGPIVGSLLIEAVGGKLLKPVLGMFSFSLALAVPFTLFAIFPNWLQNLPKSGGWLNSVKVVLGFLEVALAFKFLSIADQVYHWGILDREVYLALWIVIFFLLGMYLLGKLKFHHDSDQPYLSVPRLGMAIAVFTFVLYLIPGLFGAPLKALSGYLPPQSTLDFDLYTNKGTATETTTGDELGNVKYADKFHLPHNLHGFFDYKQALEYSKKVNKPIFIDFTGHGCVNCREMEANVWSDPQVLKRLNENFVVVALYADDKTELPESEWYLSKYDNKIKKTIGKQNSDLQITKYNANAQPLYVLIDGSEQLLTQPKAYDLEVSNFVKFLDEGLANYKKLHP